MAYGMNIFNQYGGLQASSESWTLEFKEKHTRNSKYQFMGQYCGTAYFRFYNMAKKPDFFAVECSRPVCIYNRSYVDYTSSGGLPNYNDPYTNTNVGTVYTMDSIDILVYAPDLYPDGMTTDGPAVPVTVYYYGNPIDRGNGGYGLRIKKSDGSCSFDYRQPFLKLTDVKAGNNYQSGVPNGGPYGAGTFGTMFFLPSGRSVYNSSADGFDTYALFANCASGSFSATERFTGNLGSFKGTGGVGTSYNQLTYSLGIANVTGL